MIFLFFGNDLKAQNEPAIIPQPNAIEWKTGYFELPSKIMVDYNTDAKEALVWLQILLKTTNSTVIPNENGNNGEVKLVLNKDQFEALGGEGYQLKISGNQIRIFAATNAGLFYGIQTFRQFFPPEIETGTAAENLKFRNVEITDVPRFSWRGSMLDVARSFLDVAYIKKHLDRMALYKLNRLHLHLSDDQGWRIEIKAYPKLTATGGKGAIKNGRAGYLSQQDYKEIQEYAAQRNIVIIPEIDMPGHIYAALASYPELNCKDFSNIDSGMATVPELFDGYKVGWNHLCLENPEVYDFVEEVIKELSEITDGKWIHIGGDEIEHLLYKDFVQKTDSLVTNYGKTAIGWEETAKANLSENFIIQRWNGETEINPDQKIIDSFCKYFYLDHGNSAEEENTYKWCNKNGLTLEGVYNYSTNDNRVIGVEAAMWSEWVISDDRADDRLWPRTIAVAELAWTNPEKQDFPNFVSRLAAQTYRLDNLDISYFRSAEVNWKPVRSKGIFSNLQIPKEKKNEK